MFIYIYMGTVYCSHPGEGGHYSANPIHITSPTGHTDFRFNNHGPAASHPMNCRHTHNYNHYIPHHRPAPLRRRIWGVGHRLAKGDPQYIP